MVKEHRKTPEEEELSTELNELELELVQNELDLATLRGELRVFEARYLRIVGTHYAELDEIKAQVAELQARLTPKDKSSEEHATQARAKAHESAQAVNIEQEPLTEQGFSPSDNLKRLYREVARSMHPDLAVDEEERSRRGRFMAEANQAYERDDEDRLEAILREWEISPESVTGDGGGAELMRVIRKINQVKGRLSEIEAEINLLKESELYQLRIRVEEAKNQGRDLLTEMVAHLDGQINVAKKKRGKSKRGK